MPKPIKFPTLAQMQLGSLVTDERRKCGCMIYHASRIENAMWQNRWPISPLCPSRLTAVYAENTLRNRRKALCKLASICRRAGLRIRKDRTIVKGVSRA